MVFPSYFYCKLFSINFDDLKQQSVAMERLCQGQAMFKKVLV